MMWVAKILAKQYGTLVRILNIVQCTLSRMVRKFCSRTRSRTIPLLLLLTHVVLHVSPLNPRGSWFYEPNLRMPIFIYFLIY